MKRAHAIVSVPLLFLVLISVHIGYEKYNIWKVEHSGIPDVVNSIRTEDMEYLTIIANSNSIENEEDFAREVIHMYFDNSFHTIKFMEYSERLKILVYLHDKDIGKLKPVCQIEYISLEYGGSCEMGKYGLYLDGREIEL